MPIDTIGTILGNTMRINHALVENVSCDNNQTGSMLISYYLPGGNGRQTLRLNLNRNTIIFNSLGQRMCVCCIQKGARINVVASAATTRSIPPQANALIVTVKQNGQSQRPPFQPWPPQNTAVTTGRIIMVDFSNNAFVMENPNNWNAQTRFIVTNATTFRNRYGMPIRFADLQPGDFARVTHSNAQTLSIPPQSTAYQVQLL